MVGFDEIITKFAEVQEKFHGRSIIQNILFCGKSFEIISKAAETDPDQSLGPGVQSQAWAKHDQGADEVESEPVIRRTEGSYVLREKICILEKEMDLSFFKTFKWFKMF